VSTDGASEPRSYHHGDLRHALIAAARRILEERGSSAVSLREVARTAGVSHNAPYRHFPTREAMLAAVAMEGFAELAQALRGAQAAGSLRAMGQAYVDFALANRGLFRLMFGEEIRKSGHPALMETAQAALSLLNTAIAPSGRWPERAATVAAWSLVHGLAQLILDGQLADELTDGPAREELVRCAAGIFETGLRAADQSWTPGPRAVGGHPDRGST